MVVGVKSKENKMIFENFYVKAKVEMLKVPLPLSAFLKPNTTDKYYTIPEYLATLNHTVERFSNDGYFIKGFGFNIAGLDELRTKFSAYGMTFGVDVFILSPKEVQDELALPEWQEAI